MAMVTDIDFSFPKLTTNTMNNNNNESRNPSIWRISSLVFPDQNGEDNEEEDEREVTRKHRSFSEYESGESEARMDLLWQDFNEKELKRTTSWDWRIKIRRDRSGSGDFSGGDSSPDRERSTCFRRDLNPNKPSEGRSRLVRRPKRTSTVVLLRALRKLFFVHSLARNNKTL